MASDGVDSLRFSSLLFLLLGMDGRDAAFVLWLGVVILVHHAGRCRAGQGKKMLCKTSNLAEDGNIAVL